MRDIGFALILAGLIWGGCTFAYMETTVGSDTTGYNSPRIYNLDLADRRRTHLIGAGVTLLSGILLFGFGSMKPEETVSSTPEKKCPFCAELIKSEATICRYCSKEIPEQ